MKKFLKKWSHNDILGSTIILPLNYERLHWGICAFNIKTTTFHNYDSANWNLSEDNMSIILSVLNELPDSSSKELWNIMNEKKSSAGKWI